MPVQVMPMERDHILQFGKGGQFFFIASSQLYNTIHIYHFTIVIYDYRKEKSQNNSVIIPLSIVVIEVKYGYLSA